jgi:hypothetical protein
MSLLGVLVLENFGQHIEERSPEGWVYGACSRRLKRLFGDRLWNVSVLLVQKRAARLEVAGEEVGAGHEGYGHHLGGGQTDLRVVEVADGLQELVAGVVGGGYGIFQSVLPIQREGFRRPSDREDMCSPG